MSRTEIRLAAYAERQKRRDAKIAKEFLEDDCPHKLSRSNKKKPVNKVLEQIKEEDKIKQEMLNHPNKEFRENVKEFYSLLDAVNEANKQGAFKSSDKIHKSNKKTYRDKLLKN